MSPTSTATGCGIGYVEALVGIPMTVNGTTIDLTIGGGGLPALSFRSVPTFEVAGAFVTFDGNPNGYIIPLSKPGNIGFGSGQSLDFVISVSGAVHSVQLCVP